LKKSAEKKTLLDMLKLKEIIPLRLPLKVSSISIYPANKQNNFSNSKKTKIFRTKLNSVFVHKKTI
jgi:hypothetical protein